MKIVPIEGEQRIGATLSGEKHRPVFCSGKHTDPSKRQHVFNPLQARLDRLPRLLSAPLEFEDVSLDLDQYTRRREQCPLLLLTGVNDPSGESIRAGAAGNEYGRV